MQRRRCSGHACARLGAPHSQWHQYRSRYNGMLASYTTSAISGRRMKAGEKAADFYDLKKHNKDKDMLGCSSPSKHDPLAPPIRPFPPLFYTAMPCCGQERYRPLKRTRRGRTNLSAIKRSAHMFRSVDFPDNAIVIYPQLLTTFPHTQAVFSHERRES